MRKLIRPWTRTRRVAVTVATACVACWLAPAALAGYPVQPSDGKTLATLIPSFLVYRDADEISPRVDISTSRVTSSSGALILGAGYIGGCYPTTPFGEPGKFFCSRKFARPGTYYWQFVYDKYVCETVFGYRSCSYRLQYGPVWQFTLALAPSPERLDLPVFKGPSAQSRVDPLYSKIASEIAKKPAQVRCWGATDWNSLHVDFQEHEGGGEGLRWVLGFVRPRSQIVNLAPEVCRRLDLVAYQRKRPGTFNPKLQIAEAVDTLAHEAIHAYGIEDEAVTECSSMQLTELVAMRLGTTLAYGRDLGRFLWRYRWPQTVGTEYFTDDCYDGGPLDLFPNSDIWP